MIAVPAVRGATGTWNTDTNNVGWGTASNWAGVVPNGIDDVANFTFNITGARTVFLEGNRTLGALTIGDSASGYAAYTLSANGQGGQLIFEASTPGASADLTFSPQANNVNNVIAASVVLNDNLTVHALQQLNTGSHIIGNISGTGGISLTTNGTHVVGVANDIGVLVLTGVNTFSGGITTQEGLVRLDNPYAAGTGNITINPGGQVWFNSGAYVSNNITLSSLGWTQAGVFGALGGIRSDASSTFNGAITLAGDSRLRATAGITNLVNSAIGESGGSKNLQINDTNTGAPSTGTWVFNNTNTYTGKTTVNAGTLRVGNGGTTGSLGNTSLVELGTNSTLEFRRSDNVTVTTPFTQIGTTSNFVHSGTGTLTLDNGSSAYAGNTTVSGMNAKLTFGSGGTYTFAGTGTVALSNGADIEFNTSSNVTLGTVTGSVNSYLIQSGTGTTTLGGTADNGQLWAMVNNGTLVLGKNPSTASFHAIGANNNLGLVVNGGTTQILAASGGDQIFTEVDVQVNAGTFDLNGNSEGFDVLTGSGGVVTNTAATTASTLTLGENNSNINVVSPIVYNSRYAGVIQDGAGVVAVTKIGAGLQTLSGTNTYSGATTINNGVLSITGSTSSTGAVAVNSGGTLSGTGSVGNVTLAGGGSIRPGATNLDSAAGILSMSSLTVNGGDIRMNVWNEVLNIAGAANFAGASTFSPTFSTLPTLGSIPLVVAGSGITGITPSLTGVPTSTRSTFALNNTGSTLELNVTGAAAKSVTWNGPGSWGADTSASFLDGVAPEKFFNLDAVTFGDGPAFRTVNITGTVTPTSVTVNNSAGNDYTFLGGVIAGGGARITKTGNGTLNLNTANTFGGAATITGGTIKTGTGTALGDAFGQTFVSGGGTLDVNGQNLGAEVINIAGAGVGGNGALINTGAQQTQSMRFLTLTGNATVGGTNRFDVRAQNAGVDGQLDLGGFTLTKLGANSFGIVGQTNGVMNVTDGNILVEQGTLQLEGTAMIRGSGTLTWNSGTQALFYQTAAANITRPMVWNGITVDTLAQTGGIGSNITVAGDTTFVATGGTLTFTGNMTETGGARSVVKNNAGTLVLGGNNAITGGFTSTGGTTQLTGINTFGGPISLTNATLQVLGTTTKDASLGNASSIAMNASTLTLNLTSNYTLPATTLVNGNTINFAGQMPGVTLTINTALGSAPEFNTLNVQQGSATLASGGNVTVNQINVGTVALGTGNVGTLNVQPGAALTARTFYIAEGSGTSGFVNQTGGTVTVIGSDIGNDGSFQIGRWGSGTGSIYNLSGGTLNVTNATSSLGIDNTNPTFNISGGTANLYRLLVDGRSATGPIGGTLNLSGGELAIGSGGLGNMGNGQVNITGGTLSASATTTFSSGMTFANNSATLDTRVNNVTVSGALYGSGGFTKVGNGRLILSNAGNQIYGTINANAGETYVTGSLTSSAATVNVNNGATLLLDGTGTNTGIINGTVNVNSGGLLYGSGNGTTSAKAGTVVVAAGGEVRPGMSIGTLSAGAFTMNGGKARFELNGTTTTSGGGVNDLIAASGALTFTGGTIIPSFTTAPTSGNTYTLFTSTGLTGLPTMDATSTNSRLTYLLSAAGNNVTLNVTGATKSLTWTGTTDNVWDVNTTQNWGDPATEKFFQADSVTFDGAASGTITLAGSLQPVSTTVNSGTNYTFSGAGSIDTGSLTKAGAGTLNVLNANTYAGATTVSGGVLSFANGALGSGQITMNGGTLQWNGSNTQDVSRRIAMVAATTATFDTNGNTVTLANPIGSSTSAAVTKVGAGTLVLAGDNTYSGTTTISDGTLQVGNGESSGSLGSGPVTINSPGKLTLFKRNTGIAFNNAISGNGTWELKGDGQLTSGGYDAIGGNNSGFTGNLSITNARILLDNQNDIGAATVTVNNTGQVFVNGGTYTNAISVTGNGWAESGGVLGAMRLTGGANWSGPVTLAGDARITANGTTETGTISGIISGTGGLIKSGQGSVILSGSASNSYAGTTTVLNVGGSVWGPLVLAKTSGNAIPGNLQIGNGTGGFANVNLGASNQIADTGVITFNGSGGNWSYLKMLGFSEIVAGLSSPLVGGVPILGGVIENMEAEVVNTNSLLTVNNSADYAYNGHFRDRASGAGTGTIGLTKDGAGTQTLIGSAITYTGPTTVNAGILRLQETSGFASPITINGGTLQTQLTSGNVNGNITNDGTVEMIAAAGANYTMGASKTLSGSGNWIKSGPGRVSFSNNTMTMTGIISVQAGTLAQDNNSNVWTAASPNVEIFAGATFDGRADSLRFNSLNGAGLLTNSYGNGAGANMDTVTVGVSNGSGVFDGNLRDGGAARAGNNAVGGGEGRGGFNFTKEGSGTQTLAGTNSYAGVTTINGGTLRIGNGGTTGTIGTNLVANNASLVFDRSNNFTVNNTISGSGAMTKAGSGTMVLSSASTYTGATTISGGTLQLGADATLPVANAGIWLDATDGATINTTSGNVTSWTNKGSLGALGNVTATAGREPTVVATEAAMNGNQVIRFDAPASGATSGGAVDQLTNALDLSNSTFTMLYAGRLTGGANYRLVSGVNNNWLFGTHGGNVDRAHILPSNGWIDQGGAVANTTAHVYSLSVNSGVSAAFHADTILRGAPTGGFNGPAGLSLGGGYNGTSEFSDGDIGEVLVFTSVLGEEERRAVEAYLSRKWKGVGTSNVLPTNTALSLTASGAKLNVNGVTQAVGSIAGVTGTEVQLGGGSLFTGSDNTSTSFDGAITGNGTLAKQGTGTWTLGGNNTIGGNVLVNDGTLLVSGSLSATAVNVGTGATLAGSGTVTAAVDIQSGGIISLGASVGQLDTGNFNLSTGSLMMLEIGGTVAGTQYDQLNVSGSITLGGTLSLALVNGFTPLPGQMFWVGLNNDSDSIAGAFSNAGITNFGNNSGTLNAAGQDWIVYYGANFETGQVTGGNDILMVVPEPATTALLGGMGLLLAGRRRRRSM